MNNCKLKTIEIEGVIQVPDSIEQEAIVKMIEGLSDYIETKGGKGFFIHREELFDDLIKHFQDEENNNEH